MPDRAPLPPNVRLATLPPAEAVAALLRRGKLTESFHWADLWQDVHARSFVVAKMADMDLLADVYAAVRAAVEEGISLREFKARLIPEMQRTGWWGKKEMVDPLTGQTVLAQLGSHRRLEIIYDTNLRTSHAAGLWARMWRARDAFPYIRYVTRRDERVRESHKRWDNLTLPIEDPIWNVIAPPNGWRCRCRLVPVSRREYDKGVTPTGERMVKQAPDLKYRDWTNPRSGATEKIPFGVDPGWAYNPGKASLQAANIKDVAKEKSDAFKAEVAKPVSAPVFEVQKTAKAAAEWAVRKNLADFADYKGVHPDVANECNLSLFDHLRDFPELRKNQLFVGSAQAQFSRWAELAKQEYVDQLVSLGYQRDLATKLADAKIKAPRVPGNRYAQSWAQPKVKGISINAKWGKDPEAFTSALVKDVAARWHPVGCDTIRAIVDHEFGHQLDDLLGLATDPEVIAAYNEAKLKDIIKEVSEYAGKDIGEFIAECWSEFCCNPQPRAFARLIGGIVKERYRSKFDPGA